MFKSSLSKYLTAFIIIIFVSFLFLSGIITSIIRTQVSDDKREKLEMSTSIIAGHFESKHVEDLETYMIAGEGSTAIALIPLISFDYDFNILVTDTSGRVLLSTIIKNEDNSPGVLGELGTVDLDQFSQEVGDGEEYLYRNGVLDGVFDERAIIYGCPIVTDEQTRGYVFALASTAKDDRLIRSTRNTVINSSLWVMLAAVIATYFITDRIIHPLKIMTRVSKKFGKGDFTERVEVYGNDEVADLARAFNNMAESLDSLEKMRNSFLASVSHDLRTPMTTISGFIDGITSGAIPKEEQDHYLGIISSEVHRLSRLVGQLLDVSRLESGDRKFVFADFDIAEVSRLVVISLGQKLDEKRLDVEFETECDQMIAYGDKDAIHQVIYNLCENGIKFSKEGGKFGIRISLCQQKKICFSVYDEGQTISEDEAKLIFDRFYKIDKSRGLDKNGVGLGLYICKTIIDGHGEDISVHPMESGCTFSFTIAQGSQPQKYRSQELMEG